MSGALYTSAIMVAFFLFEGTFVTRRRKEPAMRVAGVCVCALLLVGCGGELGTKGGSGGVAGTGGAAGASGRAGAGGQAGTGGAISAGGTTGSGGTGGAGAGVAGVTGTGGATSTGGTIGSGGMGAGGSGTGGAAGAAGATGDCATDADCSAGQFCQGPASGGYCALRAADTDCAGVIAGSWCFYYTTRAGACSLSPATAGDCPVGSACGTAEGASQAACYSPLVCGPNSACGAPQFCSYVDLATSGPTGRCSL